MPKRLAPGQPYRNRPPGMVPTNLSLTREAHTLLRELAPSAKGYGHLVSTLIQQHAVKREALRKIQEAMENIGKSQT